MLEHTERSLRVAPILVLMLALAGCGGGGGGSAGGGAGGPTPVVNGPPLAQTTLHDSAADVASHLSSLMTTGSAAGDAQAIANYILSKPAFAAAGINDDNSVWARYSDGTALVVFSNRRPDGSVSAEARPRWRTLLAGLRGRARRGWSDLIQQASAALVAPAAAAAPSTVVLPKGNVALTVNVNGYGGSASSLFVSEMNKAGYSATQKSGTVADFRGISDVAVLHVSTHGAIFSTQDGTDDYAIGTGEPFPSACFDPGCDANTSDRMARLLDIGVYPDKADAPYYIVRSGFVKRYWKLKPNAVVFLDACGSMFNGPLEDAMRTAIKDAGAISIVGWSSPVSIGGAQSVLLYLFDRMLGANSYQPESPPQRPFSVPEVVDYMTSIGRNLDPTPKDPKKVAQLQLKQYGPDASIIVPSIQNIVVQEDEKRLIVYGQFGPVPGTAKIDTLDRTPMWGSDGMTIDLPINSSGSSGPITVYGPDGQMSNAVPLTEFNGTMTLTRKLSTTLGSPAFVDVADCTKLHFRADVHSYRSAPGATPTDGSMSIENFAPDIVCTWKMTGSDALKSVNDSGQLPWSDNSHSVPPPFINARGTVAGGNSHSLTFTDLTCRANADMVVTDPVTGQQTHTNGPMFCLLGTEPMTITLQNDFSFIEQTLTVPTTIDSATLKIHFDTVSPPDDKTKS